jgi:AraC-like DNA-binding protein
MENDEEHDIVVVPPILRSIVRTTVPHKGDYIHGYMLNCGFADEIHFMKIFKKEKGISALQFRKKGTAPALSPKK